MRGAGLAMSGPRARFFGMAPCPLRGADAIVTFVVNAQQVDAVVLGEGGVAQAMEPDAVVVQCATVAPAYVAKLAETMQARDRLLVDAPV